MKKILSKLTITIGIIILLAITAYAVSQQPKKTSPVSTSTSTPLTNPDSNAITISLGQEFTLKKDQIAQIKDMNVFLQVKNFIYSPCPKGAQCIWNGLAVGYELTINGKAYDAPTGALSPEAPYSVLIKETDYKTYATFVISTS